MSEEKLQKSDIYASYIRSLSKEFNIQCDWKTILESDDGTVTFNYTFYIRDGRTGTFYKLPYYVYDAENTDIFKVAKQIRSDFKEYENKYITKNIVLKPCPFCGGDAIIDTATRPDGGCHYTVKYVKCQRCGAKTKEKICNGYYGEDCSDKEIAELWNRRMRVESED